MLLFVTQTQSDRQLGKGNVAVVAKPKLELDAIGFASSFKTKACLRLFGDRRWMDGKGEERYPQGSR